MKIGFREAKRKVIAALESGEYSHESRGSIDVKNKLHTGEVSAEQVIDIIGRCRGTDHSCSPHHLDNSIDVHVIASGSWYIKFYFLDPDTVFISVHQ
ncbi:hypothetical protein [Azotobacter salinestris]|uniref:hypothetical protein n=1 Tax=Azotobacter salinestris TaxID=69964 RepID=UPI0032DE9FB0